MKTVLANHLEAFRIVFQSIARYYWYWFFAPGLMIALFFWLLESGIDSLGADTAEAKVEWVASAWNAIVSGLKSLAHSLFKFFVLTCLSPLNAFFSEITDSKLTGRKYNFSFWRIIKDVWRAILIFSVALLLEFVLWLIFSAIGWATGMSILSDVITFVSGAFFIGLSFYDYALERHAYSFGKSWKYAFVKAPYMIICGLIFELLYLVPFLGVVIAPVVLSLSSTVLHLIMDEKSQLNVMLKMKNVTKQQTVDKNLVE